MKSSFIRWSVWFVVFGAFCLSISSQNREGILYDFHENVLQERLKLTAEQMETLAGIGRMLAAQKTLDQQNFKNQPLALVAAAVRRIQMAESLLSPKLGNEQLTALQAWKRESVKDRELFHLSEGLCLSEDQTRQVKNILDLYAARAGVPEREEIMDTGMGEFPADRYDRDRSILGRGNLDEMGGPRRERMDNLVSTRELEKEKRIRAVLNEEQNKLYKVLLDQFRKEQEARQRQEGH